MEITNLSEDDSSFFKKRFLLFPSLLLYLPCSLLPVFSVHFIGLCLLCMALAQLSGDSGLSTHLRDTKCQAHMDGTYGLVGLPIGRIGRDLSVLLGNTKYQ